MPDTDSLYMARALELARQGKGLASPNPLVGAVVVTDGTVVGEGFHQFAELKHAEVVAIEQAGSAARGATLFINLEPCSHLGRTPPCCDLIIRSGITRVVAAMADPNPLVCGSGFRRLREARVEVDTGLMQFEAEKLNEAFSMFISGQRPFVTLKAGVTLDGKIADFRGNSKWITSEASRQRAQQLRFESDAVLAGIGTVLKDDPLLTDRTGRPRRRPIQRVILDSGLRLPLSSRLVRGPHSGDIIVFCSQERNRTREADLEQLGVEVVPAPGPEDKVPFRFVLEELGRREITSLLVEGGAQVNFEALRSGLADKVLLFVSPRILGGHDSLPVFAGSGFGDLKESRSLRFDTIEKIGPDILIEAYVKPGQA